MICAADGWQELFLLSCMLWEGTDVCSGINEG